MIERKVFCDRCGQVVIERHSIIKAAGGLAVESFYHVGMKLKEIKDDVLWGKENGGEFASWKEYVDERLDIGVRHADQLIKSAIYRRAIKGSRASASQSRAIPRTSGPVRVVPRALLRFHQGW